MLKDAQVSTGDLKLAQTILISWQVVTEFVEVVPAQVVEIVDKDYVWVKPADWHSVECVRVHVDNIVHTFQDKKKKKNSQNVEKVNKIRHVEVNVIRLVLNATQCQIVIIRDMYTKTLEELQAQIKDAEELKSKKQELQELYNRSLETAKEYREQLLNSSNISQHVDTLRSIVSTHIEDLEKHQKHIIELNATIKDFCDAYQKQEEEINKLHTENQDLRTQVALLSGNAKLSDKGRRQP